MFKVPNQFRLRTHPILGSSDDIGNNGAFFMQTPFNSKSGKTRLWAFCIAADGMGWEHVSVSIRNKDMELVERVPNWEEMCFIKSVFWEAEDCVIQFHPPASTYVNKHAFVLHLWRPSGFNIPTPERMMVG